MDPVVSNMKIEVNDQNTDFITSPCHHVVMLTKERHTEHKRFDRKTYIQVTETRYKWTWLNSSLLVESWESSVVVNIRPLCKWYHTWLCYADWYTRSDTLVDMFFWRRASPLCNEFNTSSQGCIVPWTWISLIQLWSFASNPTVWSELTSK